jgi:hypothetical protein
MACYCKHGWICEGHQDKPWRSRPMVLVFAIFCIISSVVAVAVNALFPVDRMPLPMTVVVVAVDFIIAPIGVLAGGLLGPPHAKFRGTNAHSCDAGMPS